MKFAYLATAAVALLVTGSAHAADTTLNLRAGYDPYWSDVYNTYTLTSADTQQSRTVSFNAGGRVATASAHVDLATGKLGVYGISSDVGTPTAATRAQARYRDVLTFDIAGANANTITPITMIWTLHGGFENNGGIPAQTAAASITSQLIVSGFASLHAAFNTNPGNTCWCGATNFASSSVVEDGDYKIITGVFNLVGAAPTLSLDANLDATTTGGIIAAFGNTAGLRFILPESATFTSQSGVFLSQAGAVPEPASWALMIAGIGAIGGTARRRRTTVRFA